jgi:nucleoside-diphosphate-sugar epimerase
MDVLVIGGNRFMGVSLVSRLLYAGHRVTLLNRGNLADPFGTLVSRIQVNRSTDAFELALRARSFDRVVDFAGFTAQDLTRTVDVLKGRVGHYFFISTGQVYLVRTACPTPARELDYEGEVMEPPLDSDDHDSYRYGIDKRGAENVLLKAFREHGFPSTRLRIPMVNGERDPQRRFDAYLWRMLDGAPLLVPRSTATARHIYAGAVAQTLEKLVDAPPEPGEAYNLAQDETPTVRELVEAIAQRAGSEAVVVDVPEEDMTKAGLSVRAASPYSTAWMSSIDPTLAKEKLGFVHPSLPTYLDAIVESLLANGPKEPPEGYAQRAKELELLRQLGHDF